LNLWLKCPLAFKLKYIDGIREPTSPALFVGKAVHAALECYYRHQQLGLALSGNAVVERMLDSWDSLAEAEGAVFESTANEIASLKQAVDLVLAYLNTVASGEPKPLAVEVSAEARLIDPATGEDLGIPLVGIMDLVLPERAGPLIADFKTSARNGPPFEIIHEVQLSCYSYLFRKSSPVKEASLEIRSLVKTKVPQVHFHRYPARGERHFQRLFSVIRAYLDNLDSGRFVFRPGFMCSACEFRATHCRSWAG
jgi:putative RecB family exonuclease